MDSKEYLNRKHHVLDDQIDNIQRDGNALLNDKDYELLHSLKRKRLALRDEMLKIDAASKLQNLSNLSP